MKKRLLSLLLALTMTVSLAAGLSTDALADDAIADWINSSGAIEKAIDTLYGDEGHVTQSQIDDPNYTGRIVYHGDCGKVTDSDPFGTKVQYDIYEVSNPTQIDNEYIQKIFEQVGYDYTEEVQYYGIRIYGSGEMADYTMTTNEAPWCNTLTLNVGQYKGKGVSVDFRKLIVVAYIEGAYDYGNSDKGTGVTNVGDRAFDSAHYLTACFLGDTVTTIGERAFEKNEYLAAINMPENLTYIDKGAFYGCNTLTFLRALNTQITEIGERAFYSCTMLADVELPYSLRTIGAYAFAWDRILGTKNLVLPNGLTTIEEGAFAFCTHFSKLNIPNSVTRIGANAFLGAYELAELTFTEGDAVHSGTLSIGPMAFAANYSLTEVNFPDRVTSIGTAAFGACERLVRVSFGSGIRTIGARAFTSMMSDGYTAVDTLIAEFRNAGIVEESDENYTEDIDTLMNGLTSITPLADAAFSCDEPPYAVEATEETHSFPAPTDTDEGCIIHYPADNYSWLAEITDDAKWKGYNTGYSWTGHFHEFDETSTTTTAATCTTDGSIHRACTVTGCPYTEDETLAALGHSYVTTRTVEATCTESGAEFLKCTRCQNVTVRELEALGHDESGCVRVEPTCTTAGSVQGSCARCGATVDRTLPATGHNIVSPTVTKAATCTQSGLQSGWCYDCGKYIQDAVIPATGHSYDANGVCTVCGARESCDGGSSCPQAAFTDKRPVGYWSHQAIDYCVTNGILRGTTTTTFSPTEATTRGQLVTMLYRMQGEPNKDEYAKYRSPFTDTTRTAYYFEAVVWASENGIVKGMGDGTFAPNEPVTREQLAVIMMGYTEYCGNAVTGSASLSSFPDGDETHSWAREAMQWAVANGIVTGSKEGDTVKLDPRGTASREQVAQILMRYRQSFANA